MSVLRRLEQSHEQLDLTLDLDRKERIGCPEVVFGAGKDDAHLLAAVEGLYQAHGCALATRCRPSGLKVLRQHYPDAEFADNAGAVLVGTPPPADAGPIAVVTGGSSDAFVADEAEMTLRLRGVAVQRMGDIGVAGLHRMLGHLDQIRSCVAVIAIAGMDAALPTVLGGLVSTPILAVPTSVGYGVSEGGHSALNSLLSSCAPGLAVFNIDNGFGAAYHAATIARQLAASQNAASK